MTEKWSSIKLKILNCIRTNTNWNECNQNSRWIQFAHHFFEPGRWRRWIRWGEKVVLYVFLNQDYAEEGIKSDWGHILIIAFNLLDNQIKCNNQDVTPIIYRDALLCVSERRKVVQLMNIQPIATSRNRGAPYLFHFCLFCGLHCFQYQWKCQNRF